jgi:putative ABC transport system substrate-binding protein
MQRRELIRFAGAALLAWPLTAHAQSQPKVARLGYLGFGPPEASAARVQALRAGLRDLGYVEGKNLVIQFRWAGTVEQLNEAAVELARKKVDISFATSSTESEPARRATGTIPIVFATHADPESAGHVASLARPGGNMTGLADVQTAITPKRLEILRATAPRATRFGVLWTPPPRPVGPSCKPPRTLAGNSGSSS